MFDYQLTATVVSSVALICCAHAFFTRPAYRCAAFAGACFALTLPFFVSLLDQGPHGHPDLRGAVFLFLVAPLWGTGLIISVAGLFRPAQRHPACFATLVVNASALLSAFILLPPRLNF
jgi:hypothetical protein